MAAPVTFITPRQENMSLLALQQQKLEERSVALQSILKEFKEHVEERSEYHLGYPYNLTYDYTALADLMTRYSLNNLGDPFIESNYGIHTRAFEIAVLDWFANLWNLRPEEYWGYITCSGTEGNLHGIYLGRENLPNGVLYASADSHYSIFKAARMYRIQVECIPTQANGEIEYGALESALKKNADLPAILNVNIGTTVKGAVDDLDKVLTCLENAGFTDQSRFYIHCDGALFGMMLPFLGNANQGNEPGNDKTVSFAKPIGSISVSGHKFCGSPVPCGVIITRLNYIKALSSDIEYINSRDATIMGSRNGQAPIYLWYALALKGYEGLKKDVEHCMDTARQFAAMLQQHRVSGVILNDQSCTVVFPKPNDIALIRKWQLACQGDICHIVVMPNVTKEKLEQFVAEYVETRPLLMSV